MAYVRVVSKIFILETFLSMEKVYAQKKYFSLFISQSQKIT